MSGWFTRKPVENPVELKREPMFFSISAHKVKEAKELYGKMIKEETFLAPYIFWKFVIVPEYN
jgi:hypothetical protein